MLIRLADDFIGKVAQLADNSKFKLSISYLLQGFKEGKHVVMMSRELRKELERVFASHHGELNHIKKREQDSHSLSTMVTYSIEVIPIQDGSIERRVLYGTTRIYVPYGWFNNPERIEATILLIESHHDAIIYERVARGYMEAEGLSKLKPQWKVISDVGGGCGDLFARFAGERLILCIVDTDRDWPNGPLGKTAAKVDEASRGREPCERYLLPCHELENLLPERLLQDVIDFELEDGQQKTRLSQRLQTFQRIGVLGALGDFACLDLKKGLTLGHARSCEEKGHREYLSDLAERLQDKCSPPLLGFCTTATRCASSAPCDCVIFEGWGEILPHVAQYIERLSKRSEIRRIFFSDALPACQDAWREISQRIVAWGCAFPRIAT